MAAKTDKLTIIGVAVKHWDDIAAVLTPPNRRTWGGKSTRDRKRDIFVGIITALWNDDPVRKKPTGGIYASNERLQYYLNKWAYEGHLQRMWQCYLSFLSVRQRKEWLERFKRKPTRNTRPRRNTFWYHHLAALLIKITKKHPDEIRLPNWP